MLRQTYQTKREKKMTSRQDGLLGGRVCLYFLSGLLLASPVWGATAAARWLPSDVKFYFSVADYPAARPLFDKTGLGRLLQDESMQPFLKDLPQQLRRRARASWLGLMWVELGVDWRAFQEVPSGEVAWAVFEVNGGPEAVLMADVTGRQAAVKQLQDKIGSAMQKQGVSATTEQVDGTTLMIYRLPQRGDVAASSLVCFVRNDRFVAARNIELARRLVTRVGVEQQDNLSGLGAYKQVIDRCRAASSDEPHGMLYAIPFDCLEMMSKVAQGKELDVEAVPEVYRSQGFDALSALGVAFHLGDATSDIQFYASLYAPKPWSKSMQMVDLRNSPLSIGSWIGSDVAACCQVNLHADSIYANIGPFFDDVIAKGAEGTWADILAALRDDEDGPHLNLTTEVFRYMTGPAVVLETETLPVTPESPQVLLAFRAADEAKLRAGIKKAMRDDPLISTRDVAGTTCYYSTSQENEDALLWIICVAQQHLFMANDFGIVTSVLQHANGKPLADDPDFQAARSLWKEQLAGEPSAEAFYHLDRWLQVRYELLRGGQTIVSRKTLSGMINNFLGGEPIEEEKPALDGSKLPPFQQVSRYFGTFDAAVTTVDDGWTLVGHLRANNQVISPEDADRFPAWSATQAAAAQTTER